ncbi:hypothetical protein, partial [Microbulbifer epialgicus]
FRPEIWIRIAKTGRNGYVIYPRNPSATRSGDFFQGRLNTMWLPFSTKVWFYRQPIDFRKQIDGIVLLVADTLHKDPTSG